MINDNDEVQWAYLLDPTFELINTAGKPLTGGYIEVYIHGTRSKYYCASDFDGTLHPFKIPLDSLGANIVLASPAHAYDVYVYNKFGNLIMSRYNVVPATGDGTVVTDVVTITSEDGTVNVDTSDQTNWDLSIQDTVDRIDEHDIVLTGLATAVDDVKDDLDDLGDVVDNHTTQIGQLEDDVEDIETALTNKKDKQTASTFNGAAAKTVKKITQNANGEVNVEFEDIDLPPEVPNVEVTSPNGTIDVQTSTDVQTNTKTFTIDVNKTELDYINYGHGTGYNTRYSNMPTGQLLSLGVSSSKLGSNNLTLSSPTGYESNSKVTLNVNKKYIMAVEVRYSVNSVSNNEYKFDICCKTKNNVNDAYAGFTIDTSYAHEASKNFTFLIESCDETYVRLYNSESITSWSGVQIWVNSFFIIEQSALIGGSGGGSSDNDKVAVDSTATAGYLEDVLVSDSDLVSLIKSGNTLRVNVNTEFSADPKLSTMNESQIDSATSNYGSYSLQSGANKLVWDDTTHASYSWLNAQVHQMTRLSDAQGTITKCNLALSGSLAFSDPAPCFNVGIFDTNGTLLGQSGLKYYGTDFNSDEELCSVDMIEATEGSLSIQRNTRYIIMLWSCGLQIAGLDKSTAYNYTYDYNLRQNLQGNVSQPVFPAITTLVNRASVVPYITFGAAALS